MPRGGRPLVSTAGVFVTVTCWLRAGTTESDVAVICVGLSTIAELSVMPAGAFTVVTLLAKPAPVRTTLSVARRSATFGVRLVRVGTAGTLMVNVTVALGPPPGPPLVTRAFRPPRLASAPTEITAVICVGLSP